MYLEIKCYGKTINECLGALYEAKNEIEVTMESDFKDIDFDIPNPDIDFSIEEDGNPAETEGMDIPEMEKHLEEFGFRAKLIK